ncbi:MAG: DUF4124 domain-containing protein [Congregibacter sp.]
MLSRRALSRVSSQVLMLSMLGTVLLIGLSSAQDADAQTTYYRWKDAQDKLVVSDRPPPDNTIEYDVVSQRSTLVRRVKPGEGAVPAETTPRPGNEFEQVDTRLPEIETVEKNPERCARAKENIATLDGYARINIRDPDTGELRYISEEEKDIQRRKAQVIIRVHC